MTAQDMHLGRALDLFDELVELPTSEQRRRLALLAAREPDMERRISAMLAADAQEPGAVAHRLLDIAPHELLPRNRTREDDAEHGALSRYEPGDHVGPWRISRLINTGGMGAVYECQRDDGNYERRGALKSLRVELWSDALVHAFINERNNLALLDHPAIATLYDGGVDDAGRPWFVMRYVEGEPVDEWCDMKRLSVRDRVRLLTDICSALSYSHQAGILHQDIKPSNLLVTEQARLQIIDFGLSVVAGQHGSGLASPVGFSYRYTAPEVTSQHAATEQSDIYAVGVVMYRLLCDDWPAMSVAGAAFGRVSAPRPMDQLAANITLESAGQRACHSPRELCELLNGDLTAIALRAVALQPQQRFASMQELSDELHRWLEHRPVRSRVATPWRKARLMMRRNRTLAATSASLLALVCVALAFAHWEHRKTEQQTLAAQKISTILSETLGEAALSGLGAARFSSTSFLMKAESDLRASDLRAHGDLYARAMLTLAQSWKTIGDLHAATERVAEAESYTRDNPELQSEILATRASILNAQARFPEALSAAARGLEQAPEGSGVYGSLVRYQLRAETARATWGNGNRDQALEQLDAMLADAHQEGAGYAPLVAELLMLRGSWKASVPRWDGTFDDLQQAINLAQDADPLLADRARLEMIRAHQMNDRIADALPLAEKLVASRRRALGDVHPETGRALVIYALAQISHRRFDEAARNLDLAEPILLQGFGNQHPEYAEALVARSALAAVRGDYKQNLAHLRSAVDINARALGPLHVNTQRIRMRLAGNLGAQPNPTRADVDEMVTILESTLAREDEIGIPVVRGRYLLARALMLRAEMDGSREEMGRIDRLLKESNQLAKQRFTSQSLFSFQLRMGRARWLLLKGEVEAGKTLLHSVIAAPKPGIAPTATSLLLMEAYMQLARCEAGQGRPTEARRALASARAAALEVVSEHDPTLVRIDASMAQIRRTGTFN